jgi:hypothetical protein
VDGEPAEILPTLLPHLIVEVEQPFHGDRGERVRATGTAAVLALGWKGGGEE